MDPTGFGFDEREKAERIGLVSATGIGVRLVVWSNEKAVGNVEALHIANDRLAITLDSHHVTFEYPQQPLCRRVRPACRSGLMRLEGGDHLRLDLAIRQAPNLIAMVAVTLICFEHFAIAIGNLHTRAFLQGLLQAHAAQPEIRVVRLIR